MSEIRIAESDADIDSCFPVMSLLRPHLQREDFVGLVRSMAPQEYRLAYLTSDDVVQAVVGYRIIDMLRTGRMLEVDDLVSADSARSKGYGKQLLNWCYDLARSNGCSVVELDSAVHRADAHRFYFRERMYVLGFHFSHPIT
ncbi:MAG TPA: GNAT family N-acetyltransferase [Thermoanaerobaculia bacterium]|jgi:GNAT superfamily N-acetyltransferase|nr:GNAT family N-acetyltransferase [Thermoanaerobaculia bacterium]